LKKLGYVSKLDVWVPHNLKEIHLIILVVGETLPVNLPGHSQYLLVVRGILFVKAHRITHSFSKYYFKGTRVQNKFSLLEAKPLMDFNYFSREPCSLIFRRTATARSRLCNGS